MKGALARIMTGASLAVAAAALSIPLRASTVWELGDILAGVGNGNFTLFSNAGVFKETLAAGNSGETAGCGFDASLNAHLVNTTQGMIFKRRAAQNNPGAHPLLQTIATDANPQSLVFAANGDFYVGHLGGLIRRYVVNPTTGGAQAQEEYTLALVDSQDSFWLDIAADQKTIFYTSGGRNIRRVSVTINPTTNAATFSDDALFKTLPPPNNQAARALRLLPPGPGAGNDAIIGGLLVADKSNVKRLDAAGNLVMEYDASGQDDWFALALDPRDVDEAGADRAFWAGDKTTGNIWRFNVLSGVPSAAVSTGAAGSLRGLCLNGEPTTGQYSAILEYPAATTGTQIRTAVFAAGTPAPEEHELSVVINCEDPALQCANPLTAVVNAREAVSDGICTSGLATDTSDVDCGFKTYFSSPELPKAAPYAHGRGAYYHIKWLTPLTELPIVSVRISSDTSLTTIVAAIGSCQSTPRALRIFRDPSNTAEDQLAEDLTEGFYIDEWGTYSQQANRFMVAGRCATGVSEIRRPAPNRTFKAGNSIPIELKLTNASGSPITNALMDSHGIVTTVGTNGQILFSLGTPGSSPKFFNQTADGTYIANLQTGGTTGLVASPFPYALCVSDMISPPDPAVPPLYPQQCVAFKLK